MSFQALVITVLVALGCAGSVSSITLGRGPEDTEARPGDTVELHCDVNYRDGENILWYHTPSKTFLTNGRHVYRALDEDRKERYSITGSEFWHEYNLRIENVQSQDDGFFYCGYDDRGTGQSFQVLGSARLSVLVPPDESSPTCAFNLVTDSNSSGPAVGSTVDITCMWGGGNPTPTAVWYRDGTAMEATKSQGDYVWVRRKLTPEDNGLEFRCELTSEAIDAERSCTAMPLSIPPVASIIPPGPVFARVGDDVEFLCRGIGIPRVRSYAWETSRALRRSRFQRLDNNRVLRLRSVEERDDRLEITCRVETARQLTGSSTVILRVLRPKPTAMYTTPSPTLKTVTIPTGMGKQPGTRFIPDSATVGGSSVIDESTTERQRSSPVPSPTQPLDGTSSAVGLPKSTMIAIGVAAALLLCVVIVALAVFLKRSHAKKTSVRRDTSVHLVNTTYETVVEGGRFADDPHLPRQPEYHAQQSSSRPVTTPRQNQHDSSTTGVSPGVHYAKVNKKTRRSDPLYEQVANDDDNSDDGVVQGIGRSSEFAREPTYINGQMARVVPEEREDPRQFNVEGLTYAELELHGEGRLHARENPTLYAKLK